MNCWKKTTEVSLLKDGHEFGNHGLVDKSRLASKSSPFWVSLFFNGSLLLAIIVDSILQEGSPQLYTILFIDQIKL